ncbi:MAG: 50S ribosomal protein L15 [Saprospiraceae bacterium]|nr:50S ribosomal protein L15 [Saprospiraceae bacterium]
MKLHNLKPAAGSVKGRKRIARGQGSGRGGTSTRGHKGAKSRSGYKTKRNFEGGQMPLQMRLPKFGFKNPNRVTHVPLNLEQIQMIVEKYNVNKIDHEVLRKLGIVRRRDTIKLLGRGEIATKVDLTVNAASASAKEAIEKAGGSVNLV